MEPWDDSEVRVLAAQPGELRIQLRPYVVQRETQFLEELTYNLGRMVGLACIMKTSPPGHGGTVDTDPGARPMTTPTKLTELTETPSISKLKCRGMFDLNKSN